jgi:hypothetical protein
MTYEEAKELAFKTEWKVADCFSGKDCWCAIIVPKRPIKYTEIHSTIPQKIIIVPSAALDRKTAEYLVKIHNHYINNQPI